MSMLNTYSTEKVFQAQVKAEVTKIQEHLEQSVRISLRKEFDKAHTDVRAQAIIETTIQLGFRELAEEMTRDLEIELSIAG